jgi:predicted RNA-binding protein with PIN domain
MIILIDAYNLLKQLYTGEYITDQECQEYIAELNRYNNIKHHTIILMFDGGFFDMSSQHKEGQVLVVYAGRNQTADQAIKNYLRSNHNKDLLLVTADRELIDFAQKFDTVSIDPIIFDRYVKRALKKSDEKMRMAEQPVQKLPSEDESEELDRLMEQASEVIMQKPEEEEIRLVLVRQGKNANRSKKERKIMAKLNKL